MDATRRVRRVSEGICGPIEPDVWAGWERMTGNIVHPWEYGVLTAMDVAFCDEMNKELEANRAAKMAEAEKKAKKGTR